MIPQTEKLKDLVELDENGYVKAGEDGMTSKPGFFVAGDVRAKKLRQILQQQQMEQMQQIQPFIISYSSTTYE